MDYRYRSKIKKRPRGGGIKCLYGTQTLIYAYGVVYAVPDFGLSGLLRASLSAAPLLAGSAV